MRHFTLIKAALHPGVEISISEMLRKPHKILTWGGGGGVGKNCIGPAYYPGEAETLSIALFGGIQAANRVSFVNRLHLTSVTILADSDSTF